MSQDSSNVRGTPESIHDSVTETRLQRVRNSIEKIAQAKLLLSDRQTKREPEITRPNYIHGGSVVLNKICVFCGSRSGRRPEYRETAQALGRLLAEKGIELVYGGGNIGLMGAIADACLAAGGRVVGVIPEALVGREVAGRAVEHAGLSRLEIVDSMHARKSRMAELADGFIAMPGGFGTFEELFEILTWAQLGFHRKPIGLLDVVDYYEPLLALCDLAVTEGFLSPESRLLLMARSEPEMLLAALAEYRSEPVKAWIQDEKQL